VQNFVFIPPIRSVKKELSGSGRATRRWSMYLPIRQSISARPEPDNTFRADSTSGSCTYYVPRNGWGGISRNTAQEIKGRKGVKARVLIMFILIMFRFAFLLQFGDFTEFACPNQRRKKHPFLDGFEKGRVVRGRAHLVCGTSKVNLPAGYPTPNGFPITPTTGILIPTDRSEAQRAGQYLPGCSGTHLPVGTGESLSWS